MSEKPSQPSQPSHLAQTLISSITKTPPETRPASMAVDKILEEKRRAEQVREELAARGELMVEEFINANRNNFGNCFTTEKDLKDSNDFRLKFSYEGYQTLSASGEVSTLQMQTIAISKWMDNVTVFFSVLNRNSFFRSTMMSILSGNYPKWLTTPFEEMDKRQKGAASLFFLGHMLRDVSVEFVKEITSLSSDKAAPVEAVHLYLEKTRPDLIIPLGGELFICGCYHAMEARQSWMGGSYYVVIYTYWTYGTNGKMKHVKGESFLCPAGSIIVPNKLIFREATPKDSEEFTARGKKYMDMISKPSYLKYKGVGRYRNYWSIRQYKCDGRIMVDMAAFIQEDPEYSKFFGNDRYDDEMISAVNVSAFDSSYLKFLPPYVYGFSMAAKKWVEFEIDNISPIQFNSNAFDKVVIPASTKDIIRSLVTAEAVEHNDIIENKGLGYIFLLSGGPGTGKTLTAEALAETLGRPIYYVTVGELGTTVDSLEHRLKSVLTLAETWNAILLIDEIDIFVQRRGGNSAVETNAMTGVFLRLLEYYSGIMFLTTNLRGNLDPAFLSRVSLNIDYGHGLDQETRKRIWLNNLEGRGEFSEEELEKISTYPFNGRRIKNIIKLALTLARANNVRLNMDSIQRVIAHSLNEEESSEYK